MSREGAGKGQLRGKRLDQKCQLDMLEECREKTEVLGKMLHCAVSVINIIVMCLTFSAPTAWFEIKMRKEMGF